MDWIFDIALGLGIGIAALALAAFLSYLGHRAVQEIDDETSDD